MINLLHGDHHLKSRNFLQEKINAAKTKGFEIIKLVPGFKIADLKQALESQSLFGQERLVVLENVFSKKSPDQKKIIEYLFQDKINFPELLLWEEKEQRASTLKKVPHFWKIMVFKTPKLVFNFLDSLKNISPSHTLKLFSDCLKTESPEFIFYMLTRQIRLLILAQENLLEKLAPWQKTKYIKQSKKFRPELLLKIYKRLLKIDVFAKTGKTLLPLNYQLDLLILDL